MAFHDAVLQDNPRGLWLLGEASGTFADSSGRGNTSTGNGGTVTYNQTSLIPDGTGKSIRLNGVYGTFVGLPTTIADWSQAVSIEYWLRKNTAGGYNNIVGKNQDSGNYALIHYSGANTSQFVSNSIKPSNTGNSTGSALALGTTYHVVNTVTAGTNPQSTWYVNGLQSAQSSPTTSRNNSGSVRIGSTPDSFWGCMDGWIQNLAMFDYVLRADQVAAHYRGAYNRSSALSG